MKFIVIVLVLCLSGVLARILWRSGPNPILWFVLAWAPATLLATIPVEFTLPTYAPLNGGMGLQAYIYLILAFSSFAFGAAVAGRVCSDTRGTRNVVIARHPLPLNTTSLTICFLFGLGIFVFAFSRSGLVGQLSADAEEVFSSRLAFHVGFINHFLLLLDITAVIFFAKFLETSKLRFIMPMLISLLCYLATLQKSRVMFLGLSAVFLTLLCWKEARTIFFGSAIKVFASFFLIGLVVAGLLITNAIRGIGIVRYTDIESPIVEQLYIYSGAPALLNFSATLNGTIAADPPSLGIVAARSLFWGFIDRDNLNPTKYLEGINNGTALIFYWSDFRFLGVVLLSLVVGMISGLAFRMAYRRTTMGMFIGCIAFNAIVLSVYTDVFFEPTTLIIIVLAVIVNWVTRIPHKSPLLSKTLTSVR